MNKITFSLLIKILLVIVLFVILVAPFTFMRIESIVITPKPLPVKQTKKVVIEQPLHSLVLPDFKNIRDVKEKKRKFFAFIKPAIIQENEKLLVRRQQLIKIMAKLALEEPLLNEELQLLNELTKQYKVNQQYSQLHQTDELLAKIDIIPTELVLVQAANESAWGTSRFARIGLNYFGIWCYRKGCGLVPSGRNVGAKHEVAAFKSVEHAVSRYLFNINTHNAYSTFRTIRSQLRAHNEPLAPEILATGLLPYSERGIDYVLELTKMIRQNKKYFALTD